MRTLLTVRGAAVLAAAFLTGCATAHPSIRPHAAGVTARPSPPVVQEALTPPVIVPAPVPTATPPAVVAVHPFRRVLTPRPVAQVHPPVPPVRRPPVAAAPLREPSANWSGYAASGAFDDVSATWTEPAVRCTAGGATVAFWVGLGGDGSLPLYQAGSGAMCRDGVPTHFLWYELLAASSQPPQVVVDTISPGDVVSADVTVSDPSAGGVVHLADRTTGYRTAAGFVPQATTLSSAEWIVEATTTTSTGRITPLADFGTVRFSGCSADRGGADLSTLAPGRLTALLLHDANGGSAAPGAVTPDDGFAVGYAT